MTHWIANLIVFVLIAGACGLVHVVRRNRLWSDAVVQIWRRRPVSVVIVTVYVTVALLDSISWIGSADPNAAGDRVAASKPQSVVDRIFKPGSYRETSYSAPLAAAGFYDHQRPETSADPPSERPG